MRGISIFKGGLFADLKDSRMATNEPASTYLYICLRLYICLPTRLSVFPSTPSVVYLSNINNDSNCDQDNCNHNDRLNITMLSYRYMNFYYNNKVSRTSYFYDGNDIAWKTVLILPRAHLSAILTHDDVMKWKHFPRYCEFPSQRPVTRSFDVFLDLPE